MEMALWVKQNHTVPPDGGIVAATRGLKGWPADRVCKKAVSFWAIKLQMADHNILWTAPSLTIDRGLSNPVTMLKYLSVKFFSLPFVIENRI